MYMNAAESHSIHQQTIHPLREALRDELSKVIHNFKKLAEQAWEKEDGGKNQGES